MSTNVEAPPPRDYGAETRDTLQAQVDLAPELYESEAEFRPQYADLEKSIMFEQLGIDPDIGLLEAFEDYIVPSQNEQKKKSVEGDIDILKTLGKDLIEAQREADPLAEELRQQVLSGSSKVLSDLQSEYEQGDGMTQREAREVDQQSLAMAQSRGLIGQNASDYDRMKEKLGGDRKVRQQRLANLGQGFQNASAAYSLGAQDPLLALTGRASRVPGDVSAQFGTAGFSLDSSPAIFNPESAYAGALATQNYQGQLDARTASASNKAGLFGGLLGLGGSVLGGMATGGTGFFRG